MKSIFDDLSSTKQQDESKKIVTAACYYLTGDKLAEKLFEQRKSCALFRMISLILVTTMQYQALGYC